MTQALCGNESKPFGGSVEMFGRYGNQASGQPQTFRCNLPAGHDGKHKYAGTVRSELCQNLVYDVETSWTHER